MLANLVFFGHDEKTAVRGDQKTPRQILRAIFGLDSNAQVTKRQTAGMQQEYVTVGKKKKISRKNCKNREKGLA